jgi:ATP-dependent Lhr-like helicase
MIPAEKHYLVIDETAGTAIGVLDEAFTAEYGKPGVKFIIRGSPWRILQVYSDKIYVEPVDDPTGAIPSWVGEEIPVPFEVSQEVGKVRGFVEKATTAGKKTSTIVKFLTQKYPIDADSLSRALQPTFEQVENGVPVPTDKRITVEDWEDLTVLHVGFGSLTNRALAQLMGHFLTDRTGRSVAVQHDPYRIFFRTVETVDADSFITLFQEVTQQSDAEIREIVTKATVKTGLFKRRMVHVARRFGALKKWADFSTIRLSQLLKSFEGTAIYDEALKEAFTKDLDLENLIRVMNELRRNEVKLVKVEFHDGATPVARIGLERASMKTDLIPPERLKPLLVKSAKARLLSEVRTFVCTNCWNYVEMISIKDLPERPLCPECGSRALGILGNEENQARTLIEKEEDELNKGEKRMRQMAIKTARLVSTHGRSAAVALSARRVKPEDVAKILGDKKATEERFLEMILEAERKALKRRFWAD